LQIQTASGSKKISILRVDQREFGYISPEIKLRFGIDRIQTSALANCVCLILNHEETQTRVLAHIDTGNIERKCSEAVEEVGINSFDSSIIVYSPIYSEDTFRRVREFASKISKEQIELPRKDHDSNLASVGIALDGSLHDVEDTKCSSIACVWLSKRGKIMDFANRRLDVTKYAISIGLKYEEILPGIVKCYYLLEEDKRSTIYRILQSPLEPPFIVQLLKERFRENVTTENAKYGVMFTFNDPLHGIVIKAYLEVDTIQLVCSYPKDKEYFHTVVEIGKLIEACISGSLA
jgi:hypothetical protein